MNTCDDAPACANDTDPSSDLSPLGQAALAYAAEGFAVFPIYEMTAAGCSCGAHACASPGKHPRTQRGFLDASTDPAQIAKWWTAAPAANIGIATGREFPNGRFLYVVDVDPRNGGEASFASLEKRIGMLPGTYTVQTGGNGAHLYVSTATPLGGAKLTALPGIDFKGAGGYVLAPPSNHESGGKYEPAIDLPIAAMPDELLCLLLAETRQSGQAFAVEPVAIEEGDGRIAKADEYLTTVGLSIEGSQGRDVFFGIAVALTRKMLLPVDVAAECVERVYNPRLIAARTTPWTGHELYERLESARTTSDAEPGWVMSKATRDGFAALRARLGNPNRTPIAPTATRTRTKVHAGVAYDGERVKVTRAGLSAMLYNWPDWDGVLWFDVLAGRPIAIDPPLDGMTLEKGEMSKGDIAQIAHLLDCKGFLASKELIEDALWTVVRHPQRQRNVIAEYLDALPAVTSASVLPTLATDVFGCTDPFANTLLMKTLIGAVQRARSPGLHHKSMLVMKGQQHCGKTPAVKILAGERYHSTGNGNLADRDTILACQGKWLVEVEELSALGKADADALKTAIGRTHDSITKKYEPDARTFARSFVLIGTTNKDEFLTDDTGNDRYWVIEVGKVDLARLEQVRDVIWAEADFLARTESNELDEDDKAELDARNLGYLNTHPWLEQVASYLAGKKTVPSASEVLMHILKGDHTKADKRGKDAVASLMRTLGCKETTGKDSARKSVRVWIVPNAIANLPATVARLHAVR